MPTSGTPGRQTKMPPRSEELTLVATDAKELVRKGQLLECDSTQTWTTVTGIIDAFPSRPFIVIVLNPTNAPLFLAQNQWISIAFPYPSAIIHSKFHKHSAYILNPPLYETVNLAHHQPLVDRLH